jgi:hypothetical protein
MAEEFPDEESWEAISAWLYGQENPGPPLDA